MFPLHRTVPPALAAVVCLLAGRPAEATTPLYRPGDILVTTSDSVLRLDPGTLAATPVCSGFVNPVGLAVEVGGTIVVADSGASAPGEIDRCDSSGVKTVVSSGNLLRDPFGVTLAPDGGILVADYDTPAGGSVIEVDPVTGQQTDLCGDAGPGATFVNPFGLALEASGTILVADEYNRIVRCDPATGTKTVVTEGQHLDRATGVLIESPNTILVSDHEAFGGGGGLIRVDLRTGAQTPVCSGGMFDELWGVTLEPASGAWIVPDPGVGAIRVGPASCSQQLRTSFGTHGVAVVPSAPPLAFYLHGNGATANPPTLTLDSTAPVTTTPKYKDSGSISYSSGNPWRAVGTWSASPAASAQSLTANDLHTWLGLKNSDDQGTQYDLRAELDLNGLPVASSTARCIVGITRSPDLAKGVTAPFDAATPFPVSTGDVLALKLETRIGTNPDGSKCGGHSSATGLRVYFDAASRAARFTALTE